MREPFDMRTGPRIFYLCARRAGPIAGWDAWLERARELNCDWLWIGELQPRVPGHHPLAADEPGSVAPELGTEEALGSFARRARRAGLRLAADAAPAFAARGGSFARAHPDWFVLGPSGDPALPAGMGASTATATLAECDFGGPARVDLEAFWSGTLCRLAGRGFDAVVCRAAHRLPVRSWQAILGATRRSAPEFLFWADTLGAPIEAAEALAAARFDAFLSSACWWNLRADWFPDQEARLGRLAPTIGFPEEPGGERAAARATDVASGAARARFRYACVAAATWGVVVPMGYALGWRRPLGEAGPAESALFDVRADIAAFNAARNDVPAFAVPGRLLRLSAPAAPAVALARIPAQPAVPPALALLNPDPVSGAEASASGFFAGLDVSVAAADERTPARSPQALDAESRVALEPSSARWFTIRTQEPAQAGDARATAPPAVRNPVAIASVWPVPEAGRFAVRRVLGEPVDVFADVFAEGHGRLAAVVRYRREPHGRWHETPLEPIENDRWGARFVPAETGAWRFEIAAWYDRYAGWREDCIKRRDAGQPLAAELAEGEAMLEEAAAAASGAERGRLAERVDLLRRRGEEVDARAELLLAQTTAELAARHLPRQGLSRAGGYPLVVERGRARLGAWYECFPRSLGGPGRHGTFDDLIAHLPYIAGLGFDVVYLPPIHPIGHTNRKGRNNALAAADADPGSPWAIGSERGGHTAVHPELGTLDDFRRAVAAARALGLEIALDFAIQCSPDHPWIREHPEWFRWRADGSIRYAENPPKKYEDIVNVDFSSAGRAALWRELADVLLFWCRQGVRLFRVDNPHTKPLPFWEWALSEVRRHHSDVVFLSEAFTRPKLMHRLAGLGFSQSYTYFTWRNTKAEITEYLAELARSPVREYFRPNFWVNTPDINPFYLHDSGRPGFVIRAVLAATLSPSWGMYSGYELCESEPLRNADGTPREEYLDSEKYEFKHRDFAAPGNICAEIAALNRIRRDNPAFWELSNLEFHTAYDDRILFYSKRTEDNVVWVMVSLDPHEAREADVELPLEMVGAGAADGVAAEELIGGERWEWRGRRQRVRLSPGRPALILRVARA